MIRFIFFLPAMFPLFVWAQETTPDEKTGLFLSGFRQKYISSLRHGKADSIIAYYADDVRLMPEYQKTIMTKENVMIYLNAYASRFLVSEFTRRQMDIMDLGERVIELGTFS